MLVNTTVLTALLSCFSQKFSLLKLCDPAFREILRFFDAEDAARLAPCKDDKSEGQKFIKYRAYGFDSLMPILEVAVW